MLPPKVYDMFGNELATGDMVCFVEDLNTGWRQSPKLKRGQVKAILLFFGLQPALRILSERGDQY